MHGLQILKKINNKALHGAGFGVGEAVNINGVDTTVEQNDPQLNHLVAGGVTFDKNTGWSTNLDIPVKLTLAVYNRTQSSSKTYMIGKHFDRSSQLAAQRA